MHLLAFDYTERMGIKITEIALKSGDVIAVAGGVTALVGPSNAGKSLILSEVVDAAARRNDAPNPRRAISHITLDFTGSPSEFFERLAQSYPKRSAGQHSYGYIGEPHIIVNGNPIREQDISSVWGEQGNLGQVMSCALLHLDASGRLGLVGDGNIWNLYTEAPNSPVQRLYASRDLESRLDALVWQAFNQNLTVHRYSGSQISLRMGKVRAEESLPPPSPEYLEEINALPFWGQQGDGMKSFLGIALSLVTADYPIVLIDEPEAFLHPPQAYLLGRVLAQFGKPESQVIVATHSSDLLDGLTSVSAAKSELSIVRVTRQGAQNRIAQVEADTLRELYDDPLIKYYNIMDGLFANGVILCEADSDCTYYKAVLSTIENLADGRSTDSVSLHFTHCGGKARLPKAVKALRSADVAVVCAVDFDFLQNEKDFQDLITAFGGDASTLAAWRNVIVDAVSKKAMKPKRVAAKALIDEIFSKGKSAEISSSEAAKISDAVSVKSGWKEAKLYGRGLLSGDQVGAFDNLNAGLRELGIFIVEKGELERFHPEVPQDNKAAWLREVLEAQKFENSDAVPYVAAMVEHILARQ